MAYPIQPTPILKGKEAREFSKKIISNKYKPISKEAREKIDKAFENVILKGNVKF